MLAQLGPDQKFKPHISISKPSSLSWACPNYYFGRFKHESRNRVRKGEKIYHTAHVRRSLEFDFIL